MKLILSRRLVNSMINNIVKTNLILKNTLETSKVKPINDLTKEFNKIKDIPEFNKISTKPIVFGKVFRGYRNEDNLIFDLNDEAIIWSFNKATEILDKQIKGNSEREASRIMVPVNFQQGLTTTSI